MDHLVGETIVLRTTTGGGYDRFGDRLPTRVVDKRVERAVVIPEGAERVDGDYIVGGESRTATVLLPGFFKVEQDATVIIRGQEWIVDRPAFDHRSVFGSDRGGTEIFVRRATA